MSILLQALVLMRDAGLRWPNGNVIVRSLAAISHQQQVTLQTFITNQLLDQDEQRNQ